MSSDAIQCVCRFRPLPTNCVDSQQLIVESTTSDILISSHANCENNNKTSIRLDRIFDSSSSQNDIFNHVGVPSVESFILG
jgi:hypothetical protein